MSTYQNKAERRSYPGDMSKNGWRQLKKCFIIPDVPRSEGGRPPADLQEVINAILYVVKTGCSWRSLPHGLVC
jgi:transposase